MRGGKIFHYLLVAPRILRAIPFCMAVILFRERLAKTNVCMDAACRWGAVQFKRYWISEIFCMGLRHFIVHSTINGLKEDK